jgi:hypothetical protein
MGHASLMRPVRPLPTMPFAHLPLRFGPNDAAAMIAAKVARGHGTSLTGIVRDASFAKNEMRRTC